MVFCPGHPLSGPPETRPPQQPGLDHRSADRQTGLRGDGGGPAEHLRGFQPAGQGAGRCGHRRRMEWRETGRHHRHSIRPSSMSGPTAGTNPACSCAAGRAATWRCCRSATSIRWPRRGPTGEYIPDWLRPLYGHIHVWGATAQGIYKAGDTVQYKIYVRDQDNLRFTRPPGAGGPGRRHAAGADRSRRCRSPLRLRPGAGPVRPRPRATISTVEDPMGKVIHEQERYRAFPVRCLARRGGPARERCGRLVPLCPEKQFQQGGMAAVPGPGQRFHALAVQGRPPISTVNILQPAIRSKSPARPNCMPAVPIPRRRPG